MKATILRDYSRPVKPKPLEGLPLRRLHDALSRMPQSRTEYLLQNVSKTAIRWQEGPFHPPFFSPRLQPSKTQDYNGEIVDFRHPNQDLPCLTRKSTRNGRIGW